MKINTAAAGHIGPVKNGNAEWLAYDVKLNKQREMLEKVIKAIKSNIRGSKAANDAFKALPNGKSFDEIFDDDTIWISYCPESRAYGYTNSVGGNEITIGALAYRWGYWTVMGTLVHEMAHTNGADTTTHAAEGVLIPCGLSKVHDPTIVGSRETATVYIG